MWYQTNKGFRFLSIGVNSVTDLIPVQVKESQFYLRFQLLLVTCTWLIMVHFFQFAVSLGCVDNPGCDDFFWSIVSTVKDVYNCRLGNKYLLTKFKQHLKRKDEYQKGQILEKSTNAKPQNCESKYVMQNLLTSQALTFLILCKLKLFMP